MSAFLLMNAAIKLLELGLELDPNDSTFLRNADAGRATCRADISRAQQSIRRAQALVSQNFDAELTQARQMLAEMAADYAQDERFRATVNDLFSRYLERAEEALQAGNNREARTWLDAMRDDPFRILGRRADISRIDGILRRRRNRGRLVILVVLLMIGGVGGAIGFMNREPIENFIGANFFPTSTFTPTATLTPTITATPTMTFTPSDTPTATEHGNKYADSHPHLYANSYLHAIQYADAYQHAHADRNALQHADRATSTPTFTATPVELCQVVVLNTNSIRVRSRPTNRAGTPIVGWLGTGTVAPVLKLEREERNPTGPVWYFIQVNVDDANLEGWIRSDIVSNVIGSECPEIP